MKGARGGGSAARAADRLLPDVDVGLGSVGHSVRLRPSTAQLSQPLTQEEQNLLRVAQEALNVVEKRTTALVRAANERWRPAQSVYDTDETSALVFSDEEYADFLTVVETMSEAETLRAVATFIGIPQPMIDSVIQEKLKLKFLPQTKRGIPFVVRSGPRPQQE